MTTAEIQKMSIPERIVLMEEIWDTLCHDNQEISSPSWHENILKERKELIDSGKAEYITMDDLKRR